MIKHAQCTSVLRHDCCAEIKGPGDQQLLQSFDLGDAVTTAETQELHLHTKARMGNIPIVAVADVCR